MNRLLNINNLDKNDILALTALLHGDGVEFNDKEVNNTLNFYKNFKFKKEFISSEEAIKRCIENTREAREKFNSFWEYHLWYLGQTEESYYKELGDIENHKDSVFPVIESNDVEFDGWLLDGWHRFHSYVKYYPEREIPVLKLFSDKDKEDDWW